MLSLDSLKEYFSSPGLPPNLKRDLIEVLECLENLADQPSLLIGAIPRIRAIVSHWRRYAADSAEQILIELNRRWAQLLGQVTKNYKDQGIKPTQVDVVAGMRLDDSYRAQLNKKVFWEGIRDRLADLFSSLDTDLLVQLSVNKRHDDSIDQQT